MILVVDDDNAIRLSIGLMLRQAGMECEGIGTEREALSAVRRPEVELVILDMNLTLSTTGRQGIEMLRKIKVLRPELPVILLTAWGTIPLAVEGLGFGAADFVTKPWHNRDFMAKIRKALDDAAAVKAQEAHPPTLEEVERKAIKEAVRIADGNISRAAELLGITRQALYRRIEKFGLLP